MDRAQNEQRLLTNELSDKAACDVTYPVTIYQNMTKCALWILIYDALFFDKFETLPVFVTGNCNRAGL